MLLRKALGWLLLVAVTSAQFFQPEFQFSENEQDFTFQNDRFITRAANVNTPLCGVNNLTSNRIVGGREANIGAYPWMALLIDVITDDFFCGGTLITNQHVLTAAHCIQDRRPDRFKVRLQEHDLGRQSDGQHIEVRVADAVLHDQYSRITQVNDIALVVLQHPVQFGPRLRAACVPVETRWRGSDLTGLRVTAIGFGTTSFANEGDNSVLREVDLSVVPRDVCREAYGRFRNVRITQTVLCAGDPLGGKDACRGDSGGPLLFNSNGRFYVIGIVSSGFRCGEPRFPGIYTNVARYADWILQLTMI